MVAQQKTYCQTASLIGSPELFVFRDLEGIPPTLGTQATLTDMAPSPAQDFR